MYEHTTKKDYKKGKLKGAVIAFVVLSVVMLVGAFAIGLDIGPGIAIRQGLHNIVPFSYHIEPDKELSNLFRWIWGFNQAIILYYMNHRKEKMLGISVYRIIQRSVGKWMPYVVLALGLSEFVMWEIGIATSNHTLLFVDFIFQPINIFVAFCVMMNKMNRKGVIGSCRLDALEYKKDWYRLIGKSDDTGSVMDIHTGERQELLFLNLMEEGEEEYTTEIKENIRYILECVFAHEDGRPYTIEDGDGLATDKLRFRFIIAFLEAISSRRSAREKVLDYLTWCFEGKTMADTVAKKAILFFLVKSKKYGFEDIGRVLSTMPEENPRVYGWCGFWSIYWSEYANTSILYADAQLFSQFAEGIIISDDDLGIVDGLDPMVKMNAVEKWNSLVTEGL